MPFDAHKNLAISTVVTPPAPATSGTTLTVTAGEGGRFPAPPFNVTIWPASQPPTPANAEVARVTAMSGDQITAMTRAAEGLIARSIVAGDLIAATITAKALTDVESGVNFPQLGSTGDLVFKGAGPAFAIHPATPDGADTAYLALQGGGGLAPTRGAYFLLAGNESAAVGSLQFVAGDVPGGDLLFFTGNAVKRVQISRAGGVTIGGETDPGAGALLVGAGAVGAGQTYTLVSAGEVHIADAGSAAKNAEVFINANGIVGIYTNGTTTTDATSSDTRLKTDRGLVTDPEVLRATRVHHFTWTTDGTVGRGVFAQEALAVLPAAVSIGTDERDAAGNLKQPWGVDYSKYVPDLIAGWQHHDRAVREIQEAFGEVESMRNRIAFLEGAIVTMRERAARPSVINRLRTAIRSFGQWWIPSWV